MRDLDSETGYPPGGGTMIALDPETGYPPGYEPGWWVCTTCWGLWHDDANRGDPSVAWDMPAECSCDGDCHEMQRMTFWLRLRAGWELFRRWLARRGKR